MAELRPAAALHGIPLIPGVPLPESALRGRLVSDVTLAAVLRCGAPGLMAGAPRNVRLAISRSFPLALERETSRSAVSRFQFYGARNAVASPTIAAMPRGRCLRGRHARRPVVTHPRGVCACSEAVGLSYWPEPDETLRRVLLNARSGRD
jgi:hypothetical protein